jgi:hypothetical protein
MIKRTNTPFFNFAFTAFFILLSLTGFTQSIIFQIANCGGERRSMLYNDQLSDIMWCLIGKSKFSENTTLKLSENKSFQIKDLEEKTILFTKSTPTYYFDEGAKVIRLDTIPNEDGRIWFDYILAEQDLKGNIIIHCGFKAIFNGTDPAEERQHPAISQIIVLVDKNQLRPYYGTIRKLLAANKMKLPPPQKRNTHSDMDEQPPLLEKQESK